MKTLSFLVMLSLCLIQRISAQEESKTEDQIFFDKACEYFEQQRYTAAAEEFEGFLAKFPKSSLLGSAHFNLGITHYRLGNYITSKKVFRQILDQPYNERDENNLMEPYMLYKHHSCRMLAEIALKEEDYVAAEQYIEMFDEEYPYQHFCGNEWSAYDMYKAVMLAKAYEGQGQTKKAMEQLLPYIFSDALASNEEVLTELRHLLEEHYTKEQNRAEFTKALSSLEVKETKKRTKASIRLHGVTVEVQDYFYDRESNGTIEYYQQMLKEHELFQRFL